MSSECDEHALECGWGSLCRSQQNDPQCLQRWISVEDRLPKSPMALVKRKNEEVSIAYFHKDKMAWLHFYHQFPWSHWQDEKTGQWLTDVTHWMPLP